MSFEKAIENGLCIDPSKSSVKGATLYGLDWFQALTFQTCAENPNTTNTESCMSYAE